MSEKSGSDDPDVDGAGGGTGARPGRVFDATGLPLSSVMPMLTQLGLLAIKREKRWTTRGTSSGTSSSADELKACMTRTVASSCESSARRRALTRSTNRSSYASRCSDQSCAVVAPASRATGTTTAATSQASCVRIFKARRSAQRSVRNVQISGNRTTSSILRR